MAEKPGSRNEFLALLKRVLALPDVNKFEVFKALQKDLSATVLEDPKTRLIERRKESLEAMVKVSEHLALEDGKVPTIK